MAWSSTSEETEVASGVKALLSLAETLLVTAKAEDSSSLITGVGQAMGVLAYLGHEVIGIERDHPLFEAALLEGSEMATVFAQNFDLRMPGVIWVSLHETDPEKGGEPIVDFRKKALMVDLHGTGEEANINSVEFLIPPATGAELNFLGLWESEDGDDLIESGDIGTPVDLSRRDSISISPGGLRMKR